jgi:hypothetical protein
MAQKGYQNELIHEVAAWGYYDGAFHREALRLGYSGSYTDQVDKTNAPAGVNNLTGDAVPAGQVWRVHFVAARDQTSAPGTLRLILNVGGITLPLVFESTPGSGVWYNWYGDMPIPAGAFCQATLTGVTLNDTLQLVYHATIVDVNE